MYLLRIQGRNGFFLVCINGLGKSEPFLYFLCCDETLKSLYPIFRFISMENDLSKTQMVFTDKHLSERRIISEFFKNANRGLCGWHVKRAFKEQLNKLI